MSEFGVFLLYPSGSPPTHVFFPNNSLYIFFQRVGFLCPSLSLSTSTMGCGLSLNSLVGLLPSLVDASKSSQAFVILCSSNKTYIFIKIDSKNNREFLKGEIIYKKENFLHSKNGEKHYSGGIWIFV